MSIRSYHELIRLPTFAERYEYLRVPGTVGADTFGFVRYLNQTFYRTAEWRKLRREIILRDGGCDLGVAGHEIFGPVTIHHINPLRQEDLLERSAALTDPDNLICCCDRTHKAVHYGDKTVPEEIVTERSRNDTCPWRNVYG